mmetsp:Transcript_62097/g.178669  ORF Transcript_62097/g.178669 Transcript_62097/m.178669 type:complete len:250 (+) Transcript_62097:996-1745(+)
MHALNLVAHQNNEHDAEAVHAQCPQEASPHQCLHATQEADNEKPQPSQGLEAPDVLDDPKQSQNTEAFYRLDHPQVVLVRRGLQRLRHRSKSHDHAEEVEDVPWVGEVLPSDQMELCGALAEEDQADEEIYGPVHRRVLEGVALRPIGLDARDRGVEDDEEHDHGGEPHGLRHVADDHGARDERTTSLLERLRLGRQPDRPLQHLYVLHPCERAKRGRATVCDSGLPQVAAENSSPGICVGLAIRAAGA